MFFYQIPDFQFLTVNIFFKMRLIVASKLRLLVEFQAKTKVQAHIQAIELLMKNESTTVCCVLQENDGHAVKSQIQVMGSNPVLYSAAQGKVFTSCLD